MGQGSQIPNFQTALAEMLNVGDRRVLDRVMRNAGCEPLIRDQGRIPDRELNGIRMMWEFVERTDPSVPEVIIKLNGMVVSYEGVNRQLGANVATLRLELERLQAERDLRLEQEQIRRTGSGVDVDGVMAWACEVEQWRFAVRRRETAERALDQAHEALRGVTAEVRSLRAQLQEAQARLAELTGALEQWQVREAAVQQLRERLPWLTAHYDRELNGSGPRPVQVTVGFSCVSLLVGKRKWNSLRHLTGGPDMRDIRRWRNADLSARGLHECWLDGSDESLARVAWLVERVASEYPEGSGGCTLMVDALATAQALGVHLDGRVTGTVEEVIIDRESADVIRSDPAAFHQFVGQQVLEGRVTGALFAFVLTLDAIGSPPIPALLLRRAHGVADGEVVGCIDKLVRTLAGLGRRVRLRAFSLRYLPPVG
jgi:hypothetical protein